MKYLLLSLLLTTSVSAQVGGLVGGPLSAPPPTQNAQQYRLSFRLPVMGWNSWEQNNTNTSRLLLTNTADNLNQIGLRNAGYVYVVTDDGWQAARNTQGTMGITTQYADERAAGNWSPMSSYLHNLGFKFGLYRDCAFNSSVSSGNRPDTNGLAYWFSDAKWYALGGVDYIKADVLSYGYTETALSEGMNNALFLSGRPIYLMHGWYPGTNFSPYFIGRANSLRMGPQDIGTGFTSAVQSFTNFLVHWNWATTNIYWTQPGFHLDPGVMSTAGVHDTIRSMMTMYSMGSMDLFVAETAASQSITPALPTVQFPLDRVFYYTNADLIAIDQDTLVNAPYGFTNNAGLMVWQKALANGDTALAILDTNTNGNGNSIAVSWAEIGKSNWCQVFDLWNKSIGYYLGGFTFTSISNMTADAWRITQLPAAWTPPQLALTFLNSAGLSTQMDTNSIVSLVANGYTNGWLAGADVIYPFTGSTSNANSINLVNPATFPVVYGGTVTHNANGITGDGSSGFGNTGFIPSSNAVGYTTNSGMIWAYSGTPVPAVSSSVTVIIGNGGTAYLAGVRVGNPATTMGFYGLNNTAQLSDNSQSVGDFSGAIGISRIANTDERSIGKFGYRANTLDGTAAAGIPNTAMQLLCTYDGTTRLFFSNQNLRGFYFGAGMNSTQYAQFIIDWKQYERLRGRAIQEDF